MNMSEKAFQEISAHMDKLCFCLVDPHLSKSKKIMELKRYRINVGIMPTIQVVLSKLAPHFIVHPFCFKRNLSIFDPVDENAIEEICRVLNRN